MIGLRDAFSLGVLSSHIHTTYALAAGGWLGYGNDPVYVKTRCFDTFPFPDATPAQREAIGALAEELDAHRKRVLAAHADRLTLTTLYNVLEKRRSGAEMTPAERDAYDLGQVGVMLDLHQRIDRAVAEAYGWPADLPDAEILTRLVALNAERHREEARGTIRWLRPEFQNPTGGVAATQLSADLGIAETVAERRPWPKTPAEQVQAIQSALRTSAEGLDATAVARRFKGARAPKVRELLDLLVSVGRARRIGADRYGA